jgi:hypothetical protein
MGRKRRAVRPGEADVDELAVLAVLIETAADPRMNENFIVDRH